MSKNDNLVVNISSIEMYERLAAEEKLNIVDVREAEEVAHGMIADSTHVPLAELEFGWMSSILMKRSSLSAKQDGAVKSLPNFSSTKDIVR